MNAVNPIVVDREVLHGHLFCGLGGGAKGFNKSKARLGKLRAKFRCVGGIDVDPASVADFTRAAGVQGTCRDLFSREQYIAFWGHEPPADWRQAVPADILVAFGLERPNIIFLSAPCKGFSGLLAESKSKTAKYQALNELTLRGVWLALEAYKDDPVELILFENVPRIAKRGRRLLDKIVALLRAYGYAVAETAHDCGEIGGLGQSRKRFLLVARHMAKVPCFLYEPPKRPLRGVGEIIGRFPVPGPETLLPMHRMPALQWKTWVRLAFVEAGSDWRSLNRLRVENGHLTDFGLVPDYSFNGVLGVNRWQDPAGTVISESRPTNGNFSVADPREVHAHDFHGLRINGWGGSANAITASRSPGGSAQSVADPRIDGHEKSIQHGVGTWDTPAAVVKGDVSVGTGRYAVADPRLTNWHPGASSTKMRVTEWGQVGGTVTGSQQVGSGALAVADPRYAGKPVFNNVFRIVPWGQPSPAVSGPGGAGGPAVADPRTGFGPATHHNVLQVHGWDERSKTITAGNHPSGGALSVADPRPGERADYKQTKYRITGYDEQAGTVIAASTTGNGAFAVADPRPEGLNAKRDAYMTGGHYGVQDWENPSVAVPGFAKYDRGRWAVADPRDSDGDVEDFALPEANKKLVCCIRALDGTWHRPFTTLELAALQSLVDPEETLELEGLSDSAWRERIGNAVPPDAAEAIGSVMGMALLAAWSGQTFMLSSQPIWVRPIAVGLSVRQPGEGS